MTTLFNRAIDQVRASHGGQNEDKTLLQRLKHCEFRHVSISAQQRSLRCGQNLSWELHCQWQLDRALKL